MDTLGELVARERRSDAVAVRTDHAGRSMSYHDFCTTAWKAGNFLRYLGVRSGDLVAIDDDRRPEPLLALFGAALLGARVRVSLENVEKTEGVEDPRVTVADAAREADLTIPDGSRLLVYGDEPTGSRTAFWERDVWSENPAFPPTTVDPDSPVLEADGRSIAHRSLCTDAEAIAEKHGMGPETTVAVRSPLGQPGVVAAGVVAPLAVGATVVFPDETTVCDLAVGAGPEQIEIDPATALE